jgi:peptidoglycan hydrolase-like protein with peptidoglycan-binding domain
MALRSARLSGDPVLEQCLAGQHRMLAPEENLSVMRVQEALVKLGFSPGQLDGVFGPTTGAAVSAYKQSRALQPSDPVVGPGTSNGLDAEVFFDPPELDPDFAELAPFVPKHAVEPFLGFELTPLISAPLDSQRHDVGTFLLAKLTGGTLLGIVASSRAADAASDPRIPDATKQHLLEGLGPSAGRTVSFTGTDGVTHVVILLDEPTVRGRRIIVHRPSGRKAPLTLRAAICHEMTHVRNLGLGLQRTPDFNTDVFLDPNLANSFTTTTGIPSATAFNQFTAEMNARHVEWIIEQENAGNPFAARFLAPAALAHAAEFYFAETDPVFLFDDNGYIDAIVQRGHQATYQQIALWLRQVGTLMTFSGNADTQQTSAQLFKDAADSADLFALNPSSPLPDGDGLYPRDQDFV